MPTNEVLSSLFELRPQDYDLGVVTAINLVDAAATLKTYTVNYPCAPLYAGFRVSTAFNYPTAVTAQGLLTLYLYPGTPLEIAFTGGTGAQPRAGEIATGGSSGAVGIVAAVGGTWGTSGVIYFKSLTIPTTTTEAITFSGGGACSRALGIPLITFTMSSGLAAGYRYMAQLANIPSVGTYQGHALPPLLALNPGDQLLWISHPTATASGGAVTGVYQPVLIMQLRGESLANMPYWTDITVAGTGISSAM